MPAHRTKKKPVLHPQPHIMFVLVNSALRRQEWRRLCDEDSWFSTLLVDRSDTDNVPKSVVWPQSNIGMAKTIHGSTTEECNLLHMEVSKRNESVIGDGSTDMLRYCPRASITHRD